MPVREDYDVVMDTNYGVEGDDSDEDNDVDISVVKITSDDPWAAARAAAILKSVCLRAISLGYILSY